MKEFKAEKTTKCIEQKLTQMKDIIEILEASITIKHPMQPEELRTLKETFEAQDSEDFAKCRSALLMYLE